MPYRAGVASQSPCPNSVANDCSALAVTAICVVQEVAAAQGVNTQDTKVLGVDGHAAEVLGGISHSQVVANFRVAGHVLEWFAKSPKAPQLRCGETFRIHLLLVALGKQDDTVRLREWERAEDDAVNDSEYSGVSADAQG